MGIEKKSFRMRVVKHCNRLPREVVGAPPLEAFRDRLDEALSNIIYFKVSPLIAGALDWVTSKSLFQPKLLIL